MAEVEEGQFDDAPEPVKDLTQIPPNRLLTLQELLSAGKWLKDGSAEDIEQAKNNMLDAMTKLEENPLTRDEFILFNKISRIVKRNKESKGIFDDPFTSREEKVYNDLIKRATQELVYLSSIVY